MEEAHVFVDKSFLKNFKKILRTIKKYGVKKVIPQTIYIEKLYNLFESIHRRRGDFVTFLTLNCKYLDYPYGFEYGASREIRDIIHSFSDHFSGDVVDFESFVNNFVNHYFELDSENKLLVINGSISYLDRYIESVSFDFVQMILSSGKKIISVGQIYLWTFYVKRQHVRKGHGSNFLKALVDFCKKDKTTLIYISSPIENAFTFYVKNGFNILHIDFTRKNLIDFYVSKIGRENIEEVISLDDIFNRIFKDATGIPIDDVNGFLTIFHHHIRHLKNYYIKIKKGVDLSSIFINKNLSSTIGIDGFYYDFQYS